MNNRLIRPYIERIDLEELARASVKKVNSEVKKPKESRNRNSGKPSQKLPRTALESMPEMDDFVPIPELGLYIAKDRTLNGKTWNETMDKIYTGKGLIIDGIRAEMPTPYEFMTSLNYLLSGNVEGLNESDRLRILDDILKTGSYRGNHLNAKFIAGKTGKLNIETLAFDLSGKVARCVELISRCLSSDGYADITSFNNQGLLTRALGSDYEQGKNVYFWTPIEDGVARFGAGSGRANLYCCRDADNSYPSLGVRLVVRPKGASAKK